MTGRLTTLGEAMREADAADHRGAADEVTPVTVQVRPDRVRRKLALLRSIGTDDIYTLRAAIGDQGAATLAN